MFSENCYCYLNLVFSVFFVFLRTKKKKKTGYLTCSSYFLCSPCFLEQETIFKNKNKSDPKNLKFSIKSFYITLEPIGLTLLSRSIIWSHYILLKMGFCLHGKYHG